MREVDVRRAEAAYSEAYGEGGLKTSSEDALLWMVAALRPELFTADASGMERLRGSEPLCALAAIVHAMEESQDEKAIPGVVVAALDGLFPLPPERSRHTLVTGDATSPALTVELELHDDGARLLAEVDVDWDGEEVSLTVRRFEDDPTVKVVVV